MVQADLAGALENPQGGESDPGLGREGFLRQSFREAAGDDRLDLCNAWFVG